MAKNTRVATAIGLLVCSFALLYRDVIQKLVHDWAHDDNYSHGFFIVPLAAFFAWERRHKLSGLPLAPSNLGIVSIVGGLALLLAGLLGAELFLSRISMIAVLVGVVVFAAGWRHLWALAFPIGFLLLMIPLPAIIFNQIAFPLQLLASQVGEMTMRAAQIPVLREGNVMILANTSLEVAEACSGIRSLISLLTLGLVYGYFVDPRASVRVLLTLATIPIAVVTNAFRVAGTGIAAHYYGPEVAEGFFHTFSGWIVFIAAFVGVFAVAWALRAMIPPASPHPPAVASAAA